jgi:hypothetical protein
MVRRNYLAQQAATFLKFAKATRDPDVAAGLLDKAARLAAEIEEAPDASPRAPDVEQPEG